MSLLKSILICLLIITANRSRACDLCAVYTASHAQGESARGVFFGASEQFTRFNTLQRDGAEVANPGDQILNSSITQIVAGYGFNQRFALQVNLPLIDRSFRRPEDDRLVRDNESGIGDLSLVGRLIVTRHDATDFTFTAALIGGIKFPTGNSARLREETTEDHEHSGEEHEQEDEPASGIHGHDLALGSGSFDGVIGANVHVRWKRMFFDAEAQYAIRTEGDFQYRYANDLAWRLGPGFFLLLTHECTITLQAQCSGEYKTEDEFAGNEANDTAITSVYLGPRASMTWQDRFAAEISADLPVSIDNSGTQIVPDYRLRAGFTLRF